MSNDNHDATYHDGTSNPAYADINGPRRGEWPNPAVEQYEPPKKKRRVFMWFFLAVQALFILWIAVGAAGNAQEATNLTGTDADAYAAGTAIGIGLILVLWFVVDAILFMVWAVTKLAKRH